MFLNGRFIEEMYNIFTIFSTKNLKYISTAFSVRDLKKQAVVFRKYRPTNPTALDRFFYTHTRTHTHTFHVRILTHSHTDLHKSNTPFT